jgi:hypothetical protein
VGEPVVLEELESGDTLVRFLTVDLAVIDRRKPAEKRSTTSQVKCHPSCRSKVSPISPVAQPRG